MPESAFDGSKLYPDETIDDDDDDDDDDGDDGVLDLLGLMRAQRMMLRDSKAGIRSMPPWQAEVIEGMRTDDFDQFKRGVEASKGKVFDDVTYVDTPPKTQLKDLGGYYRLRSTRSGKWLSSIGIGKGTTALDIARALPSSQAHFAALLQQISSQEIEPASMKVAKLKEELGKRGLTTLGRKAELVSRLEARLAAPESADGSDARDDARDGSDLEHRDEFQQALAVQLEKQDLWEAMQNAKIEKRDLLEDMLDGFGNHLN